VPTASPILSPADLRSLREALLALEEFAPCSFAPEARLYSYKQGGHLEFDGLLLNQLNAPVLIITSESRAHRVLFKDYPSLQYIAALERRPPSVLTRAGAGPLDLFLAGKKADATANKKTADGRGSQKQMRPGLRPYLLLFLAFAAAFATLLLLLALIR